MKKDNLGDYSPYLYEKYGICDWNKKKLLLDESEIHNLIQNLENGDKTELSDIIKLPFPKFASTYLGKYEDPENITKTLGYEYVLFMLTDNQIKGVVYAIKGITTLSKASEDLALKNYYDNITHIITTPFNQFNPIINITMTNWIVKAKYIYLLKNIDKDEAERLQLTNHTFYAMEEYRGFELNEKLSILNTAIRKIVEAFIGLNNFDERLEKDEIATKYMLSKTNVKTAIETIIPMLLKSTGEMKNALGYLGKTNEVGANEYSKESYRKLDILLETMYINNNILSDETKEVLKTKNKKEIILYLTSKYMFLTEESLSKNMGLSIKDAKQLLPKKL